MDLSLQAIDFLFASSIQDGWPLSDMDCRADGIVGDVEGDEDDGTLFLNHLSSRGLSGTLVGLDSERQKLRHVAACEDTEHQFTISAVVTVVNVHQHTCRCPLWSFLWFCVFA